MNRSNNCAAWRVAVIRTMKRKRNKDDLPERGRVVVIRRARNLARAIGMRDAFNCGCGEHRGDLWAVILTPGDRLRAGDHCCRDITLFGAE